MRLMCLMTSSTISGLTLVFLFFFFNDTATTEIYTLSLHDALPISHFLDRGRAGSGRARISLRHAIFLLIGVHRSEEHTSELQSLTNLVCRLLLEKKKNDIDPVCPSNNVYESQSITPRPSIVTRCHT